eukprot:15039627-Alexandrium_andersonii.AAC.1
MATQRQRNGNAMAMRWQCAGDAMAMAMQRQRHGNAMATQWNAMDGNGVQWTALERNGMAVEYKGTQRN